MSINMQKFITQIKLHEGVKLKVYKCTAGKDTIGVGWNLEAHGPPPGMKMEEVKKNGITMQQADEMLKLQTASFVAQLNQEIPWWLTLGDVRCRVILDMAFNMGVPGLLKFKNTLAAVKEGRYPAAADGMLNSLWAKQVKGRAVRLAGMMRTGKDSEDFK